MCYELIFSDSDKDKLCKKYFPNSSVLIGLDLGIAPLVQKMHSKEITEELTMLSKTCQFFNEGESSKN